MIDDELFPAGILEWLPEIPDAFNSTGIHDDERIRLGHALELLECAGESGDFREIVHPFEVGRRRITADQRHVLSQLPEEETKPDHRAEGIAVRADV